MSHLNIIPFAFESREVRTLLIDDQPEAKCDQYLTPVIKNR